MYPQAEEGPQSIISGASIRGFGFAVGFVFSFPLGVRPLRVDLVARWFCFFLCLDHCVGVGFGRLRPRVGGCVSYSNVGPRSVSLFLVFRVLAWFCLCMRWFRFITLRSARGVGFLRRKVQIRAVYYSCLDSVPRIPAVERGRPAGRSAGRFGMVEIDTPFSHPGRPKGGPH